MWTLEILCVKINANVSGRRKTHAISELHVSSDDKRNVQMLMGMSSSAWSGEMKEIDNYDVKK